MPWKAANRDQPPNIDISKHGWNTNGSTMPSTPVYGIAIVAPKDMFQVISRKCAYDRSYESTRCGWCDQRSPVLHISHARQTLTATAHILHPMEIKNNE